MSAADLHGRVLEVVREQGPISTRKVRAAVRARAKRTDEALRALAGAGAIRSTAEGWDAAGHAGTLPGHPPPAGKAPSHGLTADALDAMTRPERVKALWAAMSSVGRERAWADLSTEQRADAIAILFDAREDRQSAPMTLSGAIDAWQRRADR